MNAPSTSPVWWEDAKIHLRNVDSILAEIIDSVESLFLAIELPDSRFLNFHQAGEFNLIADNACAHQFILGDKITEVWKNLDLSKHEVSISNQNSEIYHGIGSNVLGGPILALTWLVNELSDYNITLKSGSVITTGTLSTPIPINPGDVVTADYGMLGKLNLKFV